MTAKEVVISDEGETFSNWAIGSLDCWYCGKRFSKLDRAEELVSVKPAPFESLYKLLRSLPTWEESRY